MIILEYLALCGSPITCLHCAFRYRGISAAYRWQATMSGETVMIDVSWPPYQPSHSADDVSTPVFDWELGIVFLTHILVSVCFPLPEYLIIWQASHHVLDTIPFCESWKRRLVFSSISMLSIYVFMPFFLIPYWIYLYSSRIANGL